MLRIAVVGDFHLSEETLSLSEDSMRDIALENVNVVVALGDFGDNRVIGSAEGIDQAFALLRLTDARVRPILGNHDLQRETGIGAPQAKGTMERHLKAVSGIEHLYGVEEYEFVRLFYLCCELQPDDSCYQLQECYISTEQFDWFTAKLAERPGIPVIVFSHAPPLGSRLRTVPDVHVRATNSYLDHNHEAYRWIELVERTDNIVLWVSAHYHLGHHYPDSIMRIHETAFVNTGTHGAATRDGRRHTRIIDATDGRIEVFTLDHEERNKTKSPDYIWTKDGRHDREMEPAFHSEPQRASGAYRRKHSVSVSEGAIVPTGVWLHESIAFAADERGYLWEMEPRFGAVRGTLHIGENVQHVCADDGVLWKVAGNRVWRVDLQDPRRFIRDRQEPAVAEAFRSRKASHRTSR